MSTVICGAVANYVIIVNVLVLIVAVVAIVVQIVIINLYMCAVIVEYMCCCNSRNVLCNSWACCKNRYQL